MALTIRTLSQHAENGLENIQLKNEIKSKTKAIEFVLESYPMTINELERVNKKNIKLQTDLDQAREKLESIAYAFGLINQMIAKQK